MDVYLLYSLNQMPRLLFILSHNFVRLVFESGYYLRAVFIKLGTEDKKILLLKEGGMAADARESIRRDAAMLATRQRIPSLGNQTPLQMLKRTKLSWRRTNLF